MLNEQTCLPLKLCDLLICKYDPAGQPHVLYPVLVIDVVERDPSRWCAEDIVDDAFDVTGLYMLPVIYPDVRSATNGASWWQEHCVFHQRGDDV